MNIPLIEFAKRPHIIEKEGDNFRITSSVLMMKHDVLNLRAMVRGVLQNLTTELSKTNTLIDKFTSEAKKLDRNFNTKKYGQELEKLMGVRQLRSNINEMKKYLDNIEELAKPVMIEIQKAKSAPLNSGSVTENNTTTEHQ